MPREIALASSSQPRLRVGHPLADGGRRNFSRAESQIPASQTAAANLASVAAARATSDELHASAHDGDPRVIDTGLLREKIQDAAHGGFELVAVEPFRASSAVCVPSRSTASSENPRSLAWLAYLVINSSL